MTHRWCNFVFCTARRVRVARTSAKMAAAGDDDDDDDDGEGEGEGDVHEPA